ncbi:protein-disulfide reductase DsbD family protein [Methylocucumis oryzae]|uniref:Protein-disulfide reductase n=1 Tax=Methylocucumis oryzae TaxID=1632867 RepID=A0A0F3IHM8_9GAMM|nr:cytochrome c biogenesis protein CcdA [Methylocucumis oryzae]KJV06182.1 protein-disulfide reductase [Methylocucumis oryzae]
MTRLWFIFLCCWLSITSAYADIPVASLETALLNAEQAPSRYRIRFTIPTDHHAYLSSGEGNIYLPINLDANNELAQQGLRMNPIEQPQGVYDEFAKAQVLRDTGDFIFTLTAIETAKPKQQTVQLTVKYQLCNDVTHVCYRPKTAAVQLPAPLLASDVDVSSTLTLTEQLLQWFHSSNDNLWLSFGLMLLAGLLSAATPCVYPMLPITAMFIVNRANGNRAKEKHHALVYFAGIILTYGLLGLMAGMTGGAFNAVMQSAWANLLLAVFFTTFALALLGYFELSFMQSQVYSLDQQSSKIKGLTGTWLMGCLAGLVISPCVGPIVFALLLQVADEIAEKAAALALAEQHISVAERFMIALTGSLQMTGFGIGVGLPFFIISIVRLNKLPKAGLWLNKVKYAFGFLILYFAYTYLTKGLLVWGATESVVLAIAIGLVLIWLAVMHSNIFSPLSGDAEGLAKIQRFNGVLASLIGAWLVTSSLSSLTIAPKSSSPIASACPTLSKNTEAVHEEAGIQWHKSYVAAEKLARATGKPIFIDFFASWCANCVAFANETASNKLLNETLKSKAIAVKLVDNEPEFEQFRADPQHRQLKIGLPYFVIISPAGKIMWSGTDYKATTTMVSEINKGAS